MSDVDQLQALGQQLTSALLATYRLTGAEAQLSFLPGGVSVPDDLIQNGHVNPTQVLTWVTMNFDSPFVVGAGDAGVLIKDSSHGSSSQIYTAAASFAQALGQAGEPAWQRVTTEIANAKSLLGPTSLAQSIVCEPDDWPMPAANYWTRFDSSQTQSSTISSPATPAVSANLWRLRALEKPIMSSAPVPIVPEGVDPRISAPVNVRPPGGLANLFVPSRSISALLRPEASTTPLTAFSPVPAADTARAVVDSPPLAERVADDSGLVANRLRDSSIFILAPQVAQVTTTTSSSVTVTLEHQLVTLAYFSSGQAWWNPTFLADLGWYVPGMARGALLPVPDMGKAGQVYGLPTAMIVVRNLSVSGQWTAEAATALSSAGGALGPLSLFGARPHTEADGTTITYAHPGMQAVALVCSPLPVLPPVSDPSLK